MIGRTLRQVGATLGVSTACGLALAGCGGGDDRPVGTDGFQSLPALPTEAEPADSTTLGGQIESAPFEPETAEAPAEPPVAPAPGPTKGTAAVVKEVVDGDTIRLRNGKVVRLAQIDAPEERECHGAEAKAALAKLLPPGTGIRLQRDPALDAVDSYGRLVRYVVRGSTTVNRALVRAGHASVWFFDGEGRLADTLLADATRAKERGLGLWGACPKATLDPTTDVESGDA